MLQIRQLLNSATQSGLPRLEAQMLALHAIGQDPLDRAWLAAHDTDFTDSEQEAKFHQALERRLALEPMAYIVGFKEFFGLRLTITPAVLDPRDDTETLVLWALESISMDDCTKVLDLGTGSGAIALAIQSQRPGAQVIATEASQAARRVAEANAKRLDLPVHIVSADVSAGNWFAAVGDARFDVIVSNPPYIAEGDPHLAALKHEPALALTSGTDGLDALRNIIQHAREHLHPTGWLLLEHGYDQARAVRDLLTASGFKNVTTRADLAGVERCTGGQRI